MGVDHLAATAAAIAGIERVLARTPGRPTLLETPVAACPGWDLYALIDHLGGVHRWVCTAIEQGHGRGAAAPAPREPRELIAWFREGADHLLDRLGGDPATPVWSFSREPGHDRLVFWQRRQAFENLVHRWDAERATSVPGILDVELAADGVAEVLEVFVPRMRARGLLPSLPDGVRLVAGDAGVSWLLGDDPSQVVAQLSGRAEDLLLHLWKRRSADPLKWVGDAGRGRVTLAQPLVP